MRLLLAVLTLGVAVHAWADDVGPDRQALILTRALAYDNNLKSRAGDTVVVAICFKGDNAASKAAAEAMHRAWRTLENARVQELPMKVVLFPYPRSDLASAMAGLGIDVLYICPGLENELSAIKELTHRQHLLTIGAREDQVQAGLSLGVFQNEGKNVVTLNLPASRNEGAAFAADLLRLARVIR
jgi:hypothetical protein